MKFTNISLKKYALRPKISYIRATSNPKGICSACGNDDTYEKATIINDDLARIWGLDKATRQSFDERESMFCKQCRCSFRLRQLAEAITYIYSDKHVLKDAIKQGDFDNLSIAEINSCGTLHEIIKHSGAIYSEYGSENPSVPHEDITKLSYKNNSFDMVLNSDTLEHVPDIKKALKEVRRVLKKDGFHIFTIPVVWWRKTKQKASLLRNEISHHSVPSFHGAGEPDYLVFYEFGYDMINIIEDCGFEVKCYGLNLLNSSDTSGVFITRRKG
jgi:SAM-dependent methyltransferase